MKKMLAIDSATQPKIPKSSNRELENLRERLRQRYLHEQIQQRAYELFEARGRVHGHHEEDWALAQEQIRGERRFEKAA